MEKGFMRFKYDIKMITREPIMLLFAVLPLFLLFLFRFGFPVLFNYIASISEFEPQLYTTYIFTVALLMTPFMTGTLAGFLMLDEKDGNVLELVLLTPHGFSGYLVSRIMVPAGLSVVYTVTGFLLYNSLGFEFSLLPVVMVMTLIQSAVTALILFSLAKNKVQGLTIAKGLGLLMLPVFFDLLNNAFLNWMGFLSPYYWIYNYLVHKNTVSLLMGLAVNLVWVSITLLMVYKRTYRLKIITK